MQLTSMAQTDASERSPASAAEAMLWPVPRKLQVQIYHKLGSEANPHRFGNCREVCPWCCSLLSALSSI